MRKKEENVFAGKEMNKLAGDRPMTFFTTASSWINYYKLPSGIS
jgi:hypothetical protein